MLDMIIIFVAASVAIITAYSSITYKRGVDWYAPIGNQQRILRFVTNLLLIIVIILIFFVPMISQYIYIIFVFSFVLIFSLATVGIGVISGRSSNTNFKKICERIINNENELLDLIAKFFTVFNIFFTLPPIAYVCYLYYVVSNKKIVRFDSVYLKIIFQNSSVLVIAFSIILCFSMIGAILSCVGWDAKSGLSPIPPRKTGNYYTKRIKDRGRK